MGVGEGQGLGKERGWLTHLSSEEAGAGGSEEEALGASSLSRLFRPQPGESKMPRILRHTECAGGPGFRTGRGDGAPVGTDGPISPQAHLRRRPARDALLQQRGPKTRNALLQCGDQLPQPQGYAS